MKLVTRLFGVAALAAVIGFTMAGCEDLFSTEHSISGTATAADLGYVRFYLRAYNNYPIECKITTDLPAPYDSFTLYGDDYSPEQSRGSKTIDLPEGKKVKWTATVPKGRLYDHSTDSYDVDLGWLWDELYNN
jgi:hypothetical protein